MIRDIKLVDGDIAFDPNTFDLMTNTANLETVAQRLAITLQAFQGEYFLDIEFGTPWYQNILRKGVSINLVSTVLRRVITNVEGIDQLVSFKAEILPNRCLSVTFQARVGDDTFDAELTDAPGAPTLCIYIAPDGNNIPFVLPAGTESTGSLDFNCD